MKHVLTFLFLWQTLKVSLPVRKYELYGIFKLPPRSRLRYQNTERRLFNKNVMLSCV